MVRRTFSGKQTLDFASNLGGAVPGTILGIGYIIVFIQAPWFAVALVFALLAGYLFSRVVHGRLWQLILLLVQVRQATWLIWLPYLLRLAQEHWHLLMAPHSAFILNGWSICSATVKIAGVCY